MLQVEASNGVLANDNPNSDELTATLVAEPTNGTIVFRPNGSFDYTPNPTFHGTDLFRYIVSDGELESDPALVAIFVNSAPVATDDAYYGLINEVLTIDSEDGILANDADADGDNVSIVVNTMPVSGTLVMNNLDGTFEYTPDTDFSGTVSFTYHLNDSFEDSNEATVTINVVSELPLTGTPDSYAIREEQTLAVPVEEGVLANDGAAALATVELVSDTTHGTLSLSADGSFEYTPDTDYFGEDNFSYRVIEPTGDGVRMSIDIPVTISVQDVNDTPVAIPDAYTLTDDIRLVVTAEDGVLVNDTDIDGNKLVASIATDPSNGFVVMESDGSFIYMPRLGFVGTDSFTYTATDLRKTSEPVAVTIEVDSTATIIALPDSYAIREEMTLSVDVAAGVLTNDMHVDGAKLTATLVDEPENGTITFNADGSFEYVSDVDFYGNDTFTYTASEGTSVSPVVLVNINVENVNDPPVGVADSYQTVIDSPLTTDLSSGVLANDLDDSVVLTAELIDGPSNGQLLLDADGTFTYQPNAGFVGEDSFTYKAKDQFLESAAITATIVVTEAVMGEISTTADMYSIREEHDLVVELDRGVLLNDSSSTGRR